MQATDVPVLECDSVCKEYGSLRVLSGVSLRLFAGESLALTGPSGSGKSTLLSILGALDTPTGGSITVDDTNIEKLSGHQQTKYRGKKIGFVFQQYNLIPNLTALENVVLALEFGGYPVASRVDRAVKLLESVGIEEDQQHRRPTRLSGGQQQRVSIARALANEPTFILADEPTGNLDSATGKKIFDLLHDLSRNQNTTIVVVTHDLDIAGKTDRTFTIVDGKITTK
jgi:putative ABC transport system ATP-binding protein